MSSKQERQSLSANCLPLTAYLGLFSDELNNPVTSNPATYLTGTKEDGTYESSSASCYDFTSNSRTANGIGGYSYGTTYSWTQNFSTGCDSSWRLLCMQTGTGLTLPNFASAGKKVFVTSVKGNGNLSTWPDAGGNTGIAAGDAICRGRAQAGGLPNAANFKAWLSDSTVYAIDRLTANGPWVRPDGVKAAENKAAIIDNSLFTAISQTETGTYVYPAAWTGTDNNGQLYSRFSTCSDWTSLQAGTEGVSGESSLSNWYWSKLGFSQCLNNLALYCFED
ncbi:MAG: hypothetical protein HZA08_14710 [Nitrospirae bacterium]|nr:hypothetical protein [Nitrospirota bacterium]